MAQRGILIDVAAERCATKSPQKPHHIKVSSLLRKCFEHTLWKCKPDEDESRGCFDGSDIILLSGIAV